MAASASYEPLPLSRTFPKIAVVLGADTELGQRLLRELLLSAEIDRVHAIASSDPTVLRDLRRTYLRKVAVHLVQPDHLDRALAKIPDADLAFCCLGTDRHAYESIGRTRFHLLNYHAPLRFANAMFELGVLFVAVLSHPKADRDSSSEMYKARGDLENQIRKLRRDADEFSPFVSVFKISGMASGSSSRREHVRDTARAMRIDALAKSGRRNNPVCKKRRGKYEEIDSTDVAAILSEAKHSDDYGHGTRFWED